MVSLNPRKWFGPSAADLERDRMLQEVKNDLATAESHPVANQQSDMEMQRDLAQSYHLMYDDTTINQIATDPQLVHLLPAFSALNRTSNLSEPRLVEMARLDIEYVLLLHEINMPEDDMEVDGWAKLEALRIFGLSSVNDQKQGYRGRLVTEKIKEVRVRMEQKKKEGIL